MTMQCAEELDAHWAALTLAEKRALFAPRQAPPPLNDVVNEDVLRCIALYLDRDPAAFYALSATCRLAARALGDDYYPYADPACITIWVNRLLRLCPSLHIQPRLVFDEKTRYINLVAEASHLVACVDKLTGLVLNTEKTRANGYIFDRKVADYFGRTTALFKSHRDMLQSDPTYKEKLARFMGVWKAGVNELAARASVDRKRLFSAVWDESDLRRKRLKKE